MVLKVIGIILLAIALFLAAIVVISNTAPVIPGDYHEKTPTGGEIEAKYLAKGTYEVSSLTFKRDDSLKQILVFYPSELEHTEKQYPVIVYSNGTGQKGSQYKNLYSHLSSWGFIVLANDDPESYSGLPAEKTLSWILEENKKEDSIFFGKIDVDRIGTYGHSQGGTAVFNTITAQKHSDLYKTAVSLSPTNEELADFLALYKAATQFEDSCTYPFPITLEQNNKLAEFLVYECPEMMMYDREGTYTYYSNESGQITSRTISYCMDRGTYDSYMAQIQPILNNLNQKMQGLSAYDRELMVYRYIIDNNVYSRDAKDAGNTYGLLINHQAKCDGIALTFKWLMDMGGVPNYIITGEMLDHSDGHAWNVVEIDGQCYDLDITHDDLEISGMEDPYIYGLVNVSQSMIRPQYEIRDAYLTSYCPGTNDMSGSYHVKNGTYLYDGWSTVDLFNRLMYDCYQRGGGSFSFQFESRSQYDEFLNNTQYYIDQAADYLSSSFSINWYYMDESLALWCYVTF